MALVPFRCGWCKTIAHREAGAVNRALKLGAALYCDMEHAGYARRKHRASANKKAAKAAYDADYRARDANGLKARRAAWYQRNRDPEKERERRKAIMPRHVEYCRQPAYRAKKSEYDLRRRAMQDAGEFHESYVILRDLEREVLSRASRYDLDLANGRLNKTTNRRRDYVRTHGDRA